MKNILRQYGFPDKERIFHVGSSNEYERIFKRIIIELQRCQDNYEEMLVLLLRQLLISFHRELTREHMDNGLHDPLLDSLHAVQFLVQDPSGFHRINGFEVIALPLNVHHDPHAKVS